MLAKSVEMLNYDLKLVARAVHSSSLYIFIRPNIHELPKQVYMHNIDNCLQQYAANTKIVSPLHKSLSVFISMLH